MSLTVRVPELSAPSENAIFLNLCLRRTPAGIYGVYLGHTYSKRCGGAGFQLLSSKYPVVR